jgi:LCP family protein required for cell wall assembly
MSDNSPQHDADSPGQADSPAHAGRPGHPDSGEPPRPRSSRRRRIKRFALASTAAIVVIVAVVAGGGYLYANHLLSGVHRIPDIKALDAADQPVMPAAASTGMTVLLTSYALGKSTTTGPARGLKSGLIALIHLDADQKAGAVISLPANLVVPVPGHGNRELGDATAIGGPSLLIKTIEGFTDVRIDHYSVLSFSGTLRVISALGGVNVVVPRAVTSEGHVFQRGTNHVIGHSVIAYARQTQVSEIGRELLQQNLIRAILSKIAHQDLFNSATADLRLVRALSGAFSVDSNMTNSELESLALRLGKLGTGDGTFVDAPVRHGSATKGGDRPVHLDPALGALLWKAIRTGGVNNFAHVHPSAVTPAAPS